MEALKGVSASLHCLSFVFVGQETIVFKLQRATSSTNLQLGAFFAFWFSINSASDSCCDGVIPDFTPCLSQDVSETFKVALAGVDITVRSDAHVDEGCGAGLYT